LEIKIRTLPVENPVLDAHPSIFSLILSLIPILLDSSNESILVAGGIFFDLDTLLFQI
jgi:hypothetical protein